MATVTKTLKSSGGDFSSLITWESTEQTNLVTDGDLHVLECYDDWASGLNEQVQLSGWTTGASNYITIRCPDGEGHGGVIDGGFWIYWNVSNTYCIDCAVPYTRFEDFQIKMVKRDGGASPKCIQVNAASLHFERCIFYSDGSGNANGSIRCYSGPFTARSCLLSMTGSDTTFCIYSTGNTTQNVIENCTLIMHNNTSTARHGGYYTGWNHGTNDYVTIDNTAGYFSGTTNDWFAYSINDANTGLYSGDYNAESTGINVAGANSISTLATTDFRDFANEDYRIAVTNSDLYNSGPSVPTYTDIAGNAYITQDIGAYAFVPTVTTKTIKSSGGDYSSLITAESTEQKDLAAAGELMVFDCYDDWASGLAEQVTVAGWTTDNRYYLTIKAADGEGHGGAVDAGFYLKLATNNATALSIQQEYTRAIGLRVRNDNSGGTGIGLFTGCGGSVVEKCIASGGKDGTNNLCGGIRLATTVSQPVHIGNNICWDSRVGIIVHAATTGAWIYNNTCTKNEVYGIQSSVNTAIDAFDLSNNAMHDNANSDYIEPGSLTPTGGNNASEDLTAPGSDPVTGLVDGDFKNWSGNDFGIYTTSDLAGVGASMAWASVEDINSTLRADGVTYDNDDVALLGADTLHYTDM